ncbi:hypothetical protein JSQ81_16015 [Sporosarcina sp. Marseille-Q4063]|uniref:hypothetical protein n=1 Tax=Sporosarcina sp. Marseille-Q4063 TaxID=2810514 RepID=UPI001BAE7250|nr:hypothetical protein [Sporosarcina sp. Marseille-Q4063]QUW21296.1 hypothetical protein JSQ81_16015 [Sporosarcina sp. Marseille-Q4063]
MLVIYATMEGRQIIKVDEEIGDLVMHIVLNENEHTRRLAYNLAIRDYGAVTVVDPRYIGVEIREGITYTNMDIAKETFDIPDKLLFYAYMDPKDRKTKRKKKRK